MASTADIGIRIFLNNAASSGLSSLVGDFGLLEVALNSVARTGILAGTNIGNMSEKMRALSLAILDNNRNMEAIREAWQIADNGFRAAQADMQRISQLTATDFIGAERIQLAQMDITRCSQAVTDLKNKIQTERNIMSGAAPGSTIWQDAEARLKAYQAQLPALEDDLNRAQLKMSMLNRQGLEAQAAAFTRAQEEALAYDNQIQALSRQMKTLTNDQTAMIAKQNELAAAEEAMNTQLGIMIGSGGALILFGLAIKSSVSAASDLDSAMSNIAVNVDGAGSHMQELEQVMIDAANNSLYTTAEIADGFAKMGQNGVTATDFLTTSVGTDMMQLAEAIGATDDTGVVGAANLLSSTLQKFNIPASQSAQVADALAYSFHHGMGNIAAFQDTLNQVAGIAGTLHISLFDLLPIIDTLGQKFGATANVGNILKNMLSSLSSPTATNLKEMQDLGLIIMNQTNPAIDQLREFLSHTTTTAKKAAENFNGTVTQLQTLYNYAEKFGDKGLGNNFLQWALSTGILTSQLYDAHGNLKNLLEVLQLINNAVKAHTHGVEEATNAYKNLTNQTGSKALGSLMGTWTESKKKMYEMYEGIKQTGTAQRLAAEATDNNRAAWQKIGTTWHDIMGVLGQGLEGALKGIAQALLPILQNISTLITKSPQIRQGFTAFAIAGVVAGGVGLLAGAIALIIGPLSTIAPIVLGAFGGIMLIAGLAGVIAAHWGGISKFFEPVVNFLKQLGGDLIGQVVNSFKQLGPQLAQAFQPVGDALKDLMPALQQIGKILLPLLGGAAGLVGGILAGAFMGAIQALRMVFLGLGYVISGVLQIILGIVGIFSGVFLAIHGILTGNGKEIQAGFKQIGEGIHNIVNGFMKILIGIFTGTFGAILGFVGGFIKGFLSVWITLFSNIHDKTAQGVANVLKAIRDFVTNILDGFASLPGKAAADFSKATDGIKTVIGGLPQWVGDNVIKPIITFFQNLPHMVANVGPAIINAIKSGILASMPNLGSALSGLGGMIMSFLPHSPAEQGPLRNIDKPMPAMMKLLAEGIVSNTHLVHGAMTKVGEALMPTNYMSPSTIRKASSALVGGSINTASQSTVHHVTIQVGDKQIAEVVLNGLRSPMQLSGIGRLMK